MASDARWKASQNEEKKHFYKYLHSGKDINPPTVGPFFSQNFLLGCDFFNSKSILEVGCSPTAAIHGITEARFRVGIDPLVSEWRHFYEDSTNHIQGRGEYLPFKDSAFDIVLCLNVLDHVQSPIAVLKEICRVLKGGGTLVLWLQTFSIPKIFRKGLHLIDRPHPHHFSDSEVMAMIQGVGMNVLYHLHKRVRLKSTISVIGRRPTISSLRYLAANLLLGLNESSYLCSKTIQEPR